MKVGRDKNAVGNEGWERTDCCGKRRLEENRLLWELKLGREQTAVKSEGWEGKNCSGKLSFGEKRQL
jgi:hypothetical protein